MTRHAQHRRGILRYTPKIIADWFLNAVDRDSGDVVTHLKLQKLVYYAQAWALALLDRPLFDEDFRAWTHGPVLLSLWDEFKRYGWAALPPAENAPDIDGEVESLLRDVYRAYGEHSAKALEDLTHGEEPWMRARGTLPLEAKSSAIIRKDDMRVYYRALYETTGA